MKIPVLFHCGTFFEPNRNENNFKIYTIRLDFAMFATWFEDNRHKYFTLVVHYILPRVNLTSRGLNLTSCKLDLIKSSEN